MTEIATNKNYYISYEANKIKYGGVYQCVSSLFIGIDNEGIKNNSFKIYTFSSKETQFFITYEVESYYLKVYGFEDIMNNNKIYLFERQDGTLCLPDLKDGLTNYQEDMKMDYSSPNQPICDAYFLHKTPHDVKIKLIDEKIINTKTIKDKVFKFYESL